jgi:proliferating cell nuclear antigen
MLSDDELFPDSEDEKPQKTKKIIHKDSSNKDNTQYEKPLKTKKELKNELSSNVLSNRKNIKEEEEENNRSYFKVKFGNPVLLKKIIEGIKEIVEAAKFSWSSKGLEIITMDSSHVSLIHLHIDQTGFDEYECSRYIEIGINIEFFYKIIKTANNDDKIVIEYSDDKVEESVSIKMERPNKKSQHFSLKLLDIVIDPLDIPHIEHDSITHFNSKKFKKYCNDAINLKAEEMIIRSIDNEIIFEYEGNSIESKIYAETDEIVKYSNNIKVIVSLVKLCVFIKATSLSDKLIISISHDFPLLLEYPICDGTINIGFLKFYLAPKNDVAQ